MPAWMAATISIPRQSCRTSTGTVWGSMKSKRCFVPTWAQRAEGTSAPAQMRQSKYPAGWDEERVCRVLEHYETQSNDEAVAEDEAAYEATTHTAMGVPVGLVPAVRELIAKRHAG
jgi:hypothetical protein